MNPELSIRTATEEDIPLIGQLAHRIWPPTYKDILTPGQMEYMLEYIYSPGSLQNQMKQQQHTFLVMELHHNPVGFAAWSLVENPGIYKLHKLYVDSSIQGKGIGKATIDFIVGQLQKKGNATTLRLNVNRYNKARFFYERLGFAVKREEDVDIGNGYFMKDYVMELTL